MDGPLFETFRAELEMAEAKLLAGVMLAGKFQAGRGALDAELWDLRDRVYFGDAGAAHRLRELYLTFKGGRRM
ncbi:MAG: hypothetical protein LBS75_01715 [Synergistaceae bacterium]|jgi:hypothetical protein|nr:hypothetical protein [Synergistaceae bacterium]